MQLGNRPLFVFEMANNHMGDVEHGIKIVQGICKDSLREFRNLTFPLNFSTGTNLLFIPIIGIARIISS